MENQDSCPYCNEEIEDDDDFNEHLITMHPEMVDNPDDKINLGSDEND